MAALRVLKKRLRLADDEADIAPLGAPGKGDEGGATLLAGRFAEDVTATVRSVVSDSGGVVVADVDEQWTRPRSQAVQAVQVANAVSRTRRGTNPRLARQPIVQ